MTSESRKQALREAILVSLAERPANISELSDRLKSHYETTRVQVRSLQQTGLIKPVNQYVPRDVKYTLTTDRDIVDTIPMTVDGTKTIANIYARPTPNNHVYPLMQQFARLFNLAERASNNVDITDVLKKIRLALENERRQFEQGIAAFDRDWETHDC